MDQVTEAAAKQDAAPNGASKEAPKEAQGMLDMTKNKTAVPQNPNLVRRQFQIWISSPSWIQPLIGSLQY